MAKFPTIAHIHITFSNRRKNMVETRVSYAFRAFLVMKLLEFKKKPCNSRCKMKCPPFLVFMFINLVLIYYLFWCTFILYSPEGLDNILYSKIKSKSYLTYQI